MPVKRIIMPAKQKRQSKPTSPPSSDVESHLEASPTQRATPKPKLAMKTPTPSSSVKVTGKTPRASPPPPHVSKTTAKATGKSPRASPPPPPPPPAIPTPPRTTIFGKWSWDRALVPIDQYYIRNPKEVIMGSSRPVTALTEDGWDISQFIDKLEVKAAPLVIFIVPD